MDHEISHSHGLSNSCGGTIKCRRSGLFSRSWRGWGPQFLLNFILPEGLSIDSKTGVITGKMDQPGTHVVDLVVSNSLGTARHPFRIVVGEQIGLTPPMGWNSWYECSEGVSAEKIKAVADAFVKSGLRDHGLTYINIDWKNGKVTNYRIAVEEPLEVKVRELHQKGTCGMQVNEFHADSRRWLVLTQNR